MGGIDLTGGSSRLSAQHSAEEVGNSRMFKSDRIKLMASLFRTLAALEILVWHLIF